MGEVNDSKPVEFCKNNTALVDDKENNISYKQLRNLIDGFKRYIPERSVVIIITTNTIESIAGYAACLSNHVIPLLLSNNLKSDDIDKYTKKFKVNYIWKPDSGTEKGIFSYNRYILYKVSDKTVNIHKELALLLTTSGSTGSSKMVRISYKNIESNTRNICRYLNITSDDVAITSLPMNYTYGLSVINTCLFRHGKLVVTENMPYSGEFWKIFKRYNVTSFAGVPYTYEILRKMGLAKMNLNSLKTLMVAGGKLSSSEEEYYIDYAINNGKKFVIMYGQTEATARISYRPPDVMREKLHSIGIPIPEGKMWLEDSKGKVIDEAFECGEIVYSGENVSMGYAYSAEDLIKGYEWGNVINTGDMGYKDEQGFFYICGRKDRIVKINGIRIDLNEVEQILHKKYPGYEFRCEIEKCMNEVVSKRIKIYVAKNTNLNINEVLGYISEKMCISRKCYSIEMECN